MPGLGLGISPYFKKKTVTIPPSVPFGTIASNDFTNGAGHWVVVGSPGATFAGDGITLNGSPGGLSNYIYYDGIKTGLQNKKFQFTATINASSPFIEFGFIGRAQIGGGSAKGNAVELGGGNVAVYSVTGLPTETLSFNGNSGVRFTKAVSAGDVLTFSLEINDTTLISTASVNGGANSTDSFDTHSYNFGSAFSIASLCGPFFMNVSCNLKITAWSFSSTSLKNVARLGVGDSLLQWYYSGSVAGSTQALIGAYINAGGGNTTADVLTKMSEILQQVRSGTKVFLKIGLNDLSISVPDATLKANYQSIVTQLQSGGATVIKLLYAGDFGLGGTVAFNTWIKTTYPTTYIDTQTPLETSPGVINPTYNAGDGHLNAAGNAAEAAVIIASPLN